jgi:hypothetical protein
MTTSYAVLRGPLLADRRYVHVESVNHPFPTTAKEKNPESGHATFEYGLHNICGREPNAGLPFDRQSHAACSAPVLGHRPEAATHGKNLRQLPGLRGRDQFRCRPIGECLVVPAVLGQRGHGLVNISLASRTQADREADARSEQRQDNQRDDPRREDDLSHVAFRGPFSL